MQNWPQTVISQYSNSAHLIALLEKIDEWISPDINFEQFYDLIWNIDTAVGYGLDVWGRIVGVGRVLQLGLGSYFGFGEAGDRTGFNQSPFYNGQPTTYNFALTDDAYRQLILAKAAANITDGSIPSINQLLMNLFPNRGNAYVTDARTSSLFFVFVEAHDRTGFNQSPFMDFLPVSSTLMTMTYVFEFPLQPFEIAIVTQSGVLPRPTGVLANASYPLS